MIPAFLWAVWGWVCWLFSALKAAGGICWLCKIGVAGGVIPCDFVALRVAGWNHSCRPTHRSPAVMDPDRLTPLQHMSVRAESMPDMLAHRLARYRDARGLTDDDLCALLGITPDSLVRLRLCGCPRVPGDTGVIAAAVGCDAGRLAEIISDAH